MIQALWSNQIFRFLVIGVANTMLGYGLYALSLFLGCNYVVAALISTVIGNLVSFYTMGRYVFRHLKIQQIVKYILVVAVLYFVGIALIHLFLLLVNNDYIAGFLAAILVAAVRYVVNGRWVYAKKRAE